MVIFGWRGPQWPKLKIFGFDFVSWSPNLPSRQDPDSRRPGPSPHRYVSNIHFFIESGQKMIQCNVQFKTKSRIFIKKIIHLIGSKLFIKKMKNILNNSKGWGQSAKLGTHSAICSKLGTALQAYALNPCTKFPPNPTSRKVNT